MAVDESGADEATLKEDIDYLYTKGQVNEGFVFNNRTVLPTKCMNNCGRYIIIELCVNNTIGRAFTLFLKHLDVLKIK